MKTRLFAIVALIILVAIGCSSNDNPAAPADDGSGDNNGNGASGLTLSGCESNTFNNMGVTVFLDSNWVEINIADASGKHGVMLTSENITIGTYTFPNQYNGVYSDADANKIYDFYEGTITITSISSNSVKGTFTAKGYLFDVNTMQYDSTKVLNLTGNISK